jgi:hypothetical protein
MKLYTLEMLAIAFIPALLVGGAFLVALVPGGLPYGVGVVLWLFTRK